MQDVLIANQEDSQAHKVASEEYYNRHVREKIPYPKAYELANKKMNADLYLYMWGPKEFHPTGSLLTFDLTPRLSEIDIPVLLLCGRNDEATPEACEYFKNLLSKAEVKVIEDSAHAPFWSKREEYMMIVKQFLQEVENSY
jgi:proline iminopeptidase